MSFKQWRFHYWGIRRQLFSLRISATVRNTLKRTTEKQCIRVHNIFMHCTLFLVMVLWPHCVTDADIIFMAIWPPYVIGQAIICFPCGFFFYLSSFSSPNLNRRRLDVCHAENTGRKKSPKIAIWAPSHKFVWLYLRNGGTYRQSKKTC